jgi:hypothetical protein
LENLLSDRLLDSLTAVLGFAQSMTWCQKHPQVKFIQRTYPKGVRLSQAAMGELEKRLERLAGLEKYFVSIRPMSMTQTGLLFH